MSRGYILKAERIIACDSTASTEMSVLVVEGNKIRAILTESEAASVGEDYQVISLPGSTLLPGLIDGHVHLNFPADGAPMLDIVRQSDISLSVLSMINARKALEAGITTLRDCGGRSNLNVELRNVLTGRAASGPRVISCGPPITITGGHCWFFGGEADGVEGVRIKVRELIKNEVDFIKVMATGGGTPNTLAWQPAFSEEELRAIVEEAHLHDLKASAHCLNAESTLRAIHAGFDLIEHAGFLVDDLGNQRYDQKVAAALAEARVTVCPTLAVGHFMVRHLEEEDAPEQSNRWKNMLEKNLDQLSRMLDAGLQVIAGTDAGWRWTPFDALVDELELMAKAGMSNIDVINSATSKAAEALDLSKNIGTLSAGMNADVIAVEGNPLEKLSVLRKVKMVMKDGEIIKFCADTMP